MTLPDTSLIGESPIYTAMDFGGKRGDYTALAQWQGDADGGYTLKQVRQYRLPPIRSKAQVKRLLKRFESYNPLMDLIHCRGTKTGRVVRPVGWQELVTHNIKVLGHD